MFLAVPQLYSIRSAALERLISNKADRYAGRNAGDRATVWPKDQIGPGRTLAGIRIGMGSGAVLLKGWLSLGNRTGNLAVR